MDDVKWYCNNSSYDGCCATCSISLWIDCYLKFTHTDSHKVDSCKMRSEVVRVQFELAVRLDLRLESIFDERNDFELLLIAYMLLVSKRLSNESRKKSQPKVLSGRMCCALADEGKGLDCICSHSILHDCEPPYHRVLRY